MTTTCAAGIDVGRDFLDLALAPGGRSTRFDNLPSGISDIVARLQERGVRKVVLESIGTYGARLVRALADAGFDVGVVDPRRVKALRLAEGKHAKTDRLDAELIARFALVMDDAARPIPSAKTLEIRALSMRRRQLVALAAMEKTRLKQALDPLIAQSCRTMIAMLTSEREHIEAELNRMLAEQPETSRREELLRSIPGVGPAVAMTLLADLPELGSIDRRAIASLAGVAPHPNESGTRSGPSRIHGGRPCVRVALYWAALTAARSDHGFKREYIAMRNAGKPAKVALIAIARKIVVAANLMLREDRPWQEPA
jgi:transposase